MLLRMWGIKWAMNWERQLYGNGVILALILDAGVKMVRNNVRTLSLESTSKFCLNNGYGSIPPLTIRKISIYHLALQNTPCILLSSPQPHQVACSSIKDKTALTLANSPRLRQHRFQSPERSHRVTGRINHSNPRGKMTHGNFFRWSTAIVFFFLVLGTFTCPSLEKTC